MSPAEGANYAMMSSFGVIRGYKPSSRCPSARDGFLRLRVDGPVRGVRSALRGDHPLRARRAPHFALRPPRAHHPARPVRIHQARAQQGLNAERVCARCELQRARVPAPRRAGAGRGVPLVDRRGPRAPPAMARNVRATRAPDASRAAPWHMRACARDSRMPRAARTRTRPAASPRPRPR